MVRVLLGNEGLWVSVMMGLLMLIGMVRRNGMVVVEGIGEKVGRGMRIRE